ncbi:MAG: conjugative transposon protein TraM [Desulfotignum sp.]|nr:conjugative transposon protein TraM [Desulfotignum sp.]
MYLKRAQNCGSRKKTNKDSANRFGFNLSHLGLFHQITINSDPAQNDTQINEKQTETKFNIPAVIQDEITITQGSPVTIRITKDIEINGKIIPKNTFLQPIAQFTRKSDYLTMPIKFKDGTYLNKTSCL